MGEAAPRRVSYAEYLAMEEASEARHEYVDGVVVAKAGGTLEHARLTAEVSYRLRRALEGRGCRVLSSDGRVRVTAANEGRYADAVVVCGEVERAADVEGGWLHVEAGPGEALELSAIGASLEIDALYRDRIAPGD